MKTMPDVIKLILIYLVFMGLSPAFWTLGNIYARHVDFGDGPLYWAYVASSIPCCGLIYLLTRRFGKQAPLLMAAVAAMGLLSVIIAAGIAVWGSIIVAFSALAFPFTGASIGFQLGRRLDPKEPV